MRAICVIAGTLFPVVLLIGAERSRAAPDTPSGTIAFSSVAPLGWDLYATDVAARQTRRLTNHPALDYNASFSPAGRQIAFVSERDGNMELYISRDDGSMPRRVSDNFALDDRPAWSPDGQRIAFVSTREPGKVPGRAWNAVYVMNADGSDVKRLSASDATDYSPAWSPKGDLIAFASGSGEAGRADLYTMKPDGSDRRLVIKDGGWPAFSADGRGLFFHSRREGNWGIWRVNVDGSHLERMMPPEMEAFTPHASSDGKWLVAAVRRDGHRQIERIELATGQSTTLTRDTTDHWNPSISSDGTQVLYHKRAPDAATPNVEVWSAPPQTRLQLFRIAGSFPAFSPDGKRLAFISSGFADLELMNIDGSGRRTLHRGEARSLFGTSWSRTGRTIAFSAGGVFQGAKAEVDLLAVSIDEGTRTHTLTRDAGNNGFPSFSPDGKQVVFRSGREGSKNLYIMNADGTGIRRLTEGNWTDTMCDWSPAGEWIVFASNRDDDFEIWLIRPAGTELRKLAGGGGRNNHPHFSPDGRWIVFTSERAGYSAEEISLPRQPQPYGDLFAVGIDGTGLLRLTHNAFEEGTPAWGPEVPLRPSRGSTTQQAGSEY